MLKQVDHINIVVRNITAMSAFYVDVLGMTITKDVFISGDWIEDVVSLKGVRARVIYLSMSEGPRIELIAYDSPIAARPGNLDLPHAPGLRHMAFQVDDIDAAVEQLAAAGVRLFSKVQQVPDAQVTYAGGVRKRLVYFTDPEDNLLELCCYQ